MSKLFMTIGACAVLVMFTIFTMLTMLMPPALAAAGLAQGSLQFEPPEGWIEEAVAAPMRVAQFILPKAAGDAEDAVLVVFYFGGEGGGIEANLERWISQMEQPDGRPSEEVAISTTFEANGLAVTVLDVPGTYVAPVRPGSSMRYSKPLFRLKAAVVETPSGPYFFRLTGPERTVARWDASVISLLRNVRFQ